MSSWKFGKEQEKFARLVLLDLIDQALCKEAVSGEVSDLPGKQGVGLRAGPRPGRVRWMILRLFRLPSSLIVAS